MFAAADTIQSGMGMIIVVGLGLLTISFYLLPTIIAALRGHANLGPIVIVNVLLGWICLGWIISLAWALSHQDAPYKRHGH